MENNNLNEQTKENITPEAEKAALASEKKPLPWWVFAAIGAGVVAIVAVVLIFTLGGCKSHVDANDDFKCDLCGKKYDDGDEIAPIETIDLTITVKDSDGNLMPGVKFDVIGVANTYSLTATQDGTVKQTLEVGNYNVSYDYDTIPAGFMPDTSVLRVSKGDENITITVIDNNPNGSAERPYFISENVTALSLAAGEALYYRCHAAASRHLEINCEGVEVTYNGTTYSAEDGKISVFIEGSIDEPIFFSVKNVTEATIDTAIEMVFPLGSRDNPIELTDSANTVNMPAEMGLHYKWTATADGVLVLSTATANCNIGITKVLANDVSISASTAGTGYAYLVVSKGEEIALSISNESDEEQDIVFELTTYAGTEADPVPVLIEGIDLSLLPTSSVTFTATAGKALTILGEDKITVTYGGATENSADLGFIYIEFDADGSFTVTNTDTYINGITMTVE